MTRGYKAYALALITTLYTVNLFDRGLMIILLEPIKLDLKLSDTQLGILTGFAFSIFYSTAGIPIARWADRGDRVTITSLAMAVYAMTAMACSFVVNFHQLLIARVIAGAGDAGVQPPTYALIGDYFPDPAERNRALYIWATAGPISGLISLVLAGWLNERYGWRAAFTLTGIVALALALLTRATMREPRKRMDGRDLKALPTARQVIAVLWGRRSCRHLAAAMILMSLVGNGAAAWQAVFMIRYHHLGTAEAGLWMGGILGVAGLISLLIGRYVINRWFASNESGQMKLAATALVLGAAAFIAFLFAPTKEAAFLALTVQILVFAAFLVSPYALMQRLVPPNMVATGMTVVLFLANLIGLGLGPVILGALSDHLASNYGAQSLRWSMLSMSTIWFWAAAHFLIASTTIFVDLAEASETDRHSI
jgi:MFS family permease